MKTVTTRIPVASFSDGVVVSGPCSTCLTDDEKLHYLEVECKECGYDVWEWVNWITAEVPIPEPVEVKGEVSND